MFINIEPQPYKKNDVYKFRTATKITIICDIYHYITPTKWKIFCNVYKYMKPSKGTIFCDFYKFISNNSLSKLRNRLEDNQCIDYNRCYHKNGYSLYDFPQNCKGIKYVCPFFIGLTYNLLSDLRTTVRISKRWPNKSDTRKSTINKGRLEQIYWRIF